MVKNGIKIELAKEKKSFDERKKIRRNNTNNKKPKRGEEYDAKGTKDIGGRGGGGVEIVGAETKKEKKRPIRKQWRNPTCKKGGTKMGDLKNNALW